MPVRLPGRPRQRLLLAVATALVIAGAGALVYQRTDDGRVVTSATTTTARTSTKGSSTTSTSTTVASTTTTVAVTTTISVATTLPPAPVDTQPPTAPAPPITGFAAIALTPVASLTDPTAAAAVPGQPGVLYVATRTGRVYLLRGTTLSGPVLDIHTETDQNGEHGLLGLTLNPSGTRLVFSYTDTPAGNSHVDDVALLPDGSVDLTTRRGLFYQAQPAGRTNHKGGNVAFGPDGYLWLGLGDGGGAGDPDGNGQNPNTFLGKLIRIDPDGNGASIAHFGLRNPWRWSFDRATAELWIGDVGQDRYEEIDHLPAGVLGANFAWNRREGFHSYNGGALLPTDTQPVWEYPHDGRCSITGGFVYRGASIPGLYGAYLFSDYCGGEIRALRLDANGAVSEETSLNVSATSVSSFAEDAAGELYVLSLDDHVYAVTPA